MSILLLTYLSFLRDASYTTQPLELLNALGFENPSHDELNIVDGTSLKSSSQHEAKNHHLDVGDHGKVSPVPSPRVAEIITRSHNEESGLQITSDESAEGYSFRSLMSHIPLIPCHFCKLHRFDHLNFV